jgi:hypothetical protein
VTAATSALATRILWTCHAWARSATIRRSSGGLDRTYKAAKAGRTCVSRKAFWAASYSPEETLWANSLGFISFLTWSVSMSDGSLNAISCGRVGSFAACLRLAEGVL